MFWEYHETLYNNWDGEGTGWASQEQLNQFAFTLGLDMNNFPNVTMNQNGKIWLQIVILMHAC